MSISQSRCSQAPHNTHRDHHTTTATPTAACGSVCIEYSPPRLVWCSFVQMAKGSKKDQNAVVSREYTINLHKRLHKTYVSRRSLISSPPPPRHSRSECGALVGVRSSLGLAVGLASVHPLEVVVADGCLGRDLSPPSFLPTAPSRRRPPRPSDRSRSSLRRPWERAMSALTLA